MSLSQLVKRFCVDWASGMITITIIKICFLKANNA